MTTAKATKVFSMAVLWVLCAAAGAHAAIPRLINYQGRLTDASGAPLTGTYSMTFYIYAVATGGFGSHLWTEPQSVQATDGLFSVVLGNVTALGLNFDTDYYLGVQVGTDSEMTPRQRLAASGYAINADMVDGKHSADLALASHSHTITTTDIQDGTITDADVSASAAISGTKLASDGSVVKSLVAGSNSTVTNNNNGSWTVSASGGGGGTPASTVATLDGNSTEGSSTNYAREDHKHGLDMTVPLNLRSNANFRRTDGTLKGYIYADETIDKLNIVGNLAIDFRSGSDLAMRATGAYVAPGTNNVIDLGLSTLRWNAVWSRRLQVEESSAGSWAGYFKHTSASNSLGVYIETTDSSLGQALSVKRGGTWLLQVHNNGKVGIGIPSASPNYPLEMGGGAYCTGTTWTNASDIAYKKNIGGLRYGLSEVMKIRPREFDMKQDGSHQIGFIAQELEKIIPEVVSGEEGKKGISYGNLTSLLIKAVQEQQKEIQQMKDDIQLLKSRLSER